MIPEYPRSWFEMPADIECDFKIGSGIFLDDIMKTELLKQLEQAELENLRAIDRVKELKSQIAEAEKELSIYQLMPIGSVWRGCEVVEHDEGDVNAPIKTLHILSGWGFWLEPKYLHELIAEQRKLDAMKKAADEALNYCFRVAFPDNGLRNACEDYKQIIEKEDK